MKSGTEFILAAVPPSLLDGLPDEDQAAIRAAVGGPVTFKEYSDGVIELMFRDAGGATHFIWVDETMALGLEQAEVLMPAAPLIFVIHRVRGALSPALYHEDRLPPVHDPVVFQQRLDTLPKGRYQAMPPGDLMRELFDRYLDLMEPGAVPESAA